MSNVGDDLIASLQDALAHANGEGIGVRETTVEVPTDIDVKAIRNRLGLSQRDFAIQFGFSLKVVQNWEQGRRFPEGPARAYLKVIDKIPRQVQTALAS